jgi:hypothetical protein
MTAPDHEDERSALPTERDALASVAEGYRHDNERLKRENAEKDRLIEELRRADAAESDLEPLVRLVEQRHYRAALRAIENDTLRHKRFGGRLLTTKVWVDRWLRQSGRLL